MLASSDDVFPQPAPPAEGCWYLTGPTASGKTKIGVELALRLQAEIVSLDSMTLYRGMDIGTAKPTAEDLARVPHHLLDVVDPNQEFSLSEDIDAAHAAIAEIRGRGQGVLFVGGTPLYLKALLRGVFQGPPADWAFREQIERELPTLPVEALHQRLQVIDPLLASKLHVNDKRRIIRGLEVFKLTGQRLSHLQTQFDDSLPPAQAKVFVLSWPREALHARIDARVEQMFAAGLVDEVRGLLAKYGTLSRTALQAVGYQEVQEYLRGQEPGDRGQPVGWDQRSTGPPSDSLSSWERAGVRAGRSPDSPSAATSQHPHPSPLPQGEGTASCIAKVQARTRQFARRQETWFRSLSECTPVPMQDDRSPSEVAEQIVAATVASDGSR